jgi:NAD(P)H dehydrogenase (quinone)
MRHVVILAHPDGGSFNASVAKAYAEAARAASNEVEVRDLYRLDFDPRLRAEELPWRDDFAPGADVLSERDWIGDADVIVFVYPLWFNAPPAILKGYVERVFGMGFGYAADPPGTRPLLSGKGLVSISTSGAPGAWVEQTGALKRLQAGFDDHLAAVCGLRVLEHLHLGSVTPGIRPDAAEAMLDEVRGLARRLAAPASVSALR